MKEENKRHRSNPTRAKHETLLSQISVTEAKEDEQHHLSFCGLIIRGSTKIDRKIIGCLYIMRMEIMDRNH